MWYTTSSLRTGHLIAAHIDADQGLVSGLEHGVCTFCDGQEVRCCSLRSEEVDKPSLHHESCHLLGTDVMVLKEERFGWWRSGVEPLCHSSPRTPYMSQLNGERR